MKQILFILAIISLFACTKEQVQPRTTTNEPAQDRAGQVDWTIPNVAFTAGQTVEAKFSVTGFTSLTAFQFAMQFDTSALTYSHTTFTGQIPDFNLDCCFGMQELGYWVEPGEVRIAWVHYGPGGVTLPANTHCFSMFFTTKKAGDLAGAFPFMPGNPILPPEASDNQFNILPLTVSYQTAQNQSLPTGGTKKKKKRG